MLKSLSILSISAAILLTTTQAYSHVLCAPNNPQINVAHAHNQPYLVPRIQSIINHTIQHNQSQQKHLRAQRVRQQRALANQRRINQQRRLQAQRVRQQAEAKKSQQIRRQKITAQQARSTRQKAALQVAKYRALVQQATYQQPVRQLNYHQLPARVYANPPVQHFIPVQSVSIQINTGSQTHSHSVAQNHYHEIANVQYSYQWKKNMQQPFHFHK